MKKKTIGIIVLVAGIILLLLSLLADILCIGTNPDFGRGQIAGAIAGVIIGGVGLFLMLKK